jgi:uncharacterized protein
MSEKNRILQLLIQNKSILWEKYMIKSLAVFGSFARNDSNKRSDVDLLVEFFVSPGTEFIDLADELEDILGRKVDLVSRGAIKPGYYKEIENDLIYV